MYWLPSRSQRWHPRARRIAIGYGSKYFTFAVTPPGRDRRARAESASADFVRARAAARLASTFARRSSPSIAARKTLRRHGPRFQVGGRGPEIVPIVQGPAKTRRFFDRIAPWYDRINARIYKREWLNRVRSEIRGTRVLDVGVGTGFTTGELPTAVGIDLSREMLSRARYRGDLLRADFTRPPFKIGSFDTIVFAGSFYYLPDANDGGRIAAGRPRPGGRRILLFPAAARPSPVCPRSGPGRCRRIPEGPGLRLGRYNRLN